MGIGESNCPDLIDHTVAPKGYLAWHDWAKRMGRTHRSIKCAGCGLYVIWIPKAKRCPVDIGSNP